MGSAFADTTFLVVDTETTGFSPARDRVVEVAYLRVRGRRVLSRFTTLVDPRRPIPAIASAVHWIRDDDVIGAPTFAEVRPRLRAAARGAVVVAHNAAFDLRFLPFLARRPVVCTMRLAMHLVDSPNYRNETLAMRLCGPRLFVGTTHRALADATLTSEVLAELLRRYELSGHQQSVDGLVATIARPVRMRRFAFGRYRDMPLREVPADYLAWVGRESSWTEARSSALAELARRAAS